MGGARACQNCLERGPLTFIRTVHTRGASPRILDGMQGCQFRMTSYDEENSGHGMGSSSMIRACSSTCSSSQPQPRILAAPHGKTLSTALQLQHDAGLILSNVQVLQQLVTALP